MALLSSLIQCLSMATASVKLMTHIPEIGAETRRRKIGADFSYQMRSGTKKSVPKINMDDAKIDNKQ